MMPKVTIVGAGHVGATAASLLLMKDSADVVLVDIAENIAKGKALDLMQMRSNERFKSTICGSGDYADTAQSDIVVITAGVPRRPGMTREDLIGVNAAILQNVLTSALPASPDALYLIVTNPLDIMVNLAFELSGLPASRLMGMGGVLDSARFVHAIAQATEAEPQSIEAMVIGAHGQGMVPLVSRATVKGQPLANILVNPQEQIAAIVQATVDGGAAVVELLQTGSAFYAPASSIVVMIEALLDCRSDPLSVCARLEGEYGIDGVFLCVPTRLGPHGVEQIVEFDLAPNELGQLQRSAQAVKEQLDKCRLTLSL
ncbi:MAG: malate dehydrogenase [Coriobacteriales bacterium]|jgi:malate dehydrogenase|nr:malate dehydrogenase [Coriobacteriales bacterium]